jgi:hypothetical protein
MNAHISLDLGISTAEVAGDAISDSLRRDYLRLNLLLARLVDVIQADICLFLPFMGRLDRLLWRIDERLIASSIDQARDDALVFAEALVQMPRSEWTAAIQARDAAVARVNAEIAQVHWLLRPLLRGLVHMERQTPVRIIDELADDDWQQIVFQHVEQVMRRAARL